MLDVVIIIGFLSFSILLSFAIIGTVFILGYLIVYGPDAIKFRIRMILRSNVSFMRWLYGENFEEKMPVKVYSEGWREGDYK